MKFVVSALLALMVSVVTYAVFADDEPTDSVTAAVNCSLTPYEGVCGPC